MRFSSLLLALATLGPLTSAEEVYTNLDPGGGYSSSGYPMSPFLFTPNYTDVAHAFSPSSAGTLRSAGLVINMDDGLFAVPEDVMLNITVHADAGGAPGPVLDSWSGVRTLLPRSVFTPPPPQEFTFTGLISLDPSATYWVAASIDLSMPGLREVLFMSANNPGSGIVATRVNGPNPWSVFANVSRGPAMRIETFDTIGSRACGSQVPNSTGVAGIIDVFGSVIASENDVQLLATNLPAGQFGLFLNSMTQSIPPGPGPMPSNGDLCLSGAVGRYLGGVFNTGGGGAASLTLDLTMTPTPNAMVAITGGQTWHFQAWHRDGVGLGSNFTDVVSVSFQ